MVRKYLVAARRGLRMTQAELADAVGVTRNTIIKLESGLSVAEGIEGEIERFLGWDLGSLDAIRNGGRPMVADTDEGKGSTPAYNTDGTPKLRDEVEAVIWSFSEASKARRWEGIFKHRRTLLSREQQQRRDGLDQTGG